VQDRRADAGHPRQQKSLAGCALDRNHRSADRGRAWSRCGPPALRLFGGRPLVARAALLSASGNGEAFLAIAHAGPYSVVHFLDFRAAWFQAPGATPRKGEGTRPPDGSYAAILSNAGGKAAGKGVNWPIGVAGTVTLDAFPKSTAERATGSLDVRFDSGERLQGTFSAQACSKLFLGSAPPGRSP